MRGSIWHSGTAASTDCLGAIGEFLRSPSEAVDLATFCTQFRAGRITLRLAGLAPAVAEPALVGRLRGAFGEVLMHTASPESVAGSPCSWSPPCAYEALFRKQGRMTPGTDFPSPWVLAVEPRRGDLDVMLTLFGAACERATIAAEVFVEVVSARIDWRAAARVFVPRPVIIDRRMKHIELTDVPAPAAMEMEFLSPLVISSTNPADDPTPAFTSLGLRLEGLARWHGLTLTSVDWNGIAEAARAADWTWSDTEPVAWQRGSRRQDRWIRMNGTMGSLRVTGSEALMARIAPLIRLGAITHVGADVAFGCGRYRIVR